MNIELFDISKSFQSKPLLVGIKARFEHGKIHGIVGENGVGKTTLLKIIAGLEDMDCGKLYFDGAPMTKLRQKAITYVEQTPYLLKGTVYDNISYPLKLRGVRPGEIQNLVLPLLDELGISELAQRRADKLSSGEAQRVVLARALVFNPSVLLLDEPTANIDSDTIERIEALLIKRNKQQAMTILVVSHNLEQIKRLSDNIFLMKRGQSTCIQLASSQPVTKALKESVRISAGGL